MSKLNLDKVLLSCCHRETEIIITRSVLPLLCEVEQLYQNVVVELPIVGNDFLKCTSVLVVRILKWTDGDVSHNAIVARSPAENCEKEILIKFLRTVGGDDPLRTICQEYLKGYNLVAEQT